MCRIFITEDEQIIAEDIKYTLINFGYEVVGTAISGEDAIREIENTRPDVVLMDIMLAGEMNGIETVRYLNDRFAIPVIYITAYSDKRTMDEAFDTDPEGFLIKPIKEKQLFAAIEMAFKRNQV